MLEVNPVTFYLLAEGFGLLSVVLVIWIVIAVLRRRRKIRDIKLLATRIKQGAEARKEKTVAFVQATFNFEGDELQASVGNIELAETTYYQHLLDCLEKGKSEQMSTLDSGMEAVIDSYKCLQPREQEPVEDPVKAELETTRHENQALREDLSVVRNQMSHLVSEFSDMFGGGQDNELTLDEVMEKLSGSKKEPLTELPQVAQK